VPRLLPHERQRHVRGERLGSTFTWGTESGVRWAHVVVEEEEEEEGEGDDDDDNGRA